MLGFDPNMEVYDKVTGIATPSYKLNKLMEPQGLYDRQWVIKLNDGTKHLTVNALRISRARIMDGPGSVVWAVVPYCTPSKTGQALQGSLSTEDEPQVLGLLSPSSSLLN